MKEKDVDKVYRIEKICYIVYNLENCELLFIIRWKFKIKIVYIVFYFVILIKIFRLFFNSIFGRFNKRVKLNCDML